jgi:hypothetical protein
MEKTKESVAYRWFSSIALPVALAASTYFITSSVESSKLNSEYVKISVAILSQEKPKSDADKETQKALKSWAVRVLNSKSPVKMNSQEIYAFSSADLNELFSRINFRDGETDSSARALIKVLEGLNRAIQEPQEQLDKINSD